MPQPNSGLIKNMAETYVFFLITGDREMVKTGFSNLNFQFFFSRE